MVFCLGVIVWLGGCASEGTSFLDPHGMVAAAQKRWLFEIIGLMMIVVLPVLRAAT